MSRYFGNHHVGVYYKNWSYVGFEEQSGSWTLLYDSSNNNHLNFIIIQVTFIPIKFSINVKQGNYVSFYIANNMNEHNREMLNKNIY